LYRIPTILLAGFILPGLFFMNSEMAIEGMKHVGLTDAKWLQQIIGYGAPLAILLIGIPKIIPTRLKEWAYVGLGCIYLGAFRAHIQLGDTISEILMPLVTFGLLVLSYCMWHKMIDGK
ncbi:MAG TPA: DoxX family protein, partial [Candidatus Absconditabacterales bacterium]|nr:DoxX family protein [Candidatus Absconditabacterales bacterium]